MRINLIIPSFYPAVVYGGPIFSTLYVYRELAKFENIELYVSTTNTNMTSKLDIEPNKWLKFENFYVKYYDETIIDKFSFSLFKNIHKDIKNSDVVHIQGIFNTPIPISLFWTKVFKKPIVLSPRGSLGEWPLKNGSRFKKLWLNLFIKPFANYVVWHATSQQEKEDILKLYPNAKVKIIPNGIYVEEFNQYDSLTKEEFLKIYGKKEVKNIDKIIISMGRLQQKKGFDILIDAFYNILDKFPNSYLFIAGPDEGEKDKLVEQINKLNISDKVFFTGNLKGKEKINFLANADLFVLPSHNENFGNVYLESLAAGTPIIASKNTPWEIVEKYNCGKWVENNIEDTAKAMEEMLNLDKNPIKNNCINLAKRYDWSNIAKEFVKLFEEITNGRYFKRKN